MLIGTGTTLGCGTTEAPGMLIGMLIGTGIAAELEVVRSGLASANIQAAGLLS